MTAERRKTLRTIMNVAWSLYHEGQRTFSQALTGAWRFVKRLKAAKPSFQRAHRTDRSVIVERMGGRAFVGGRRSAAYLTAACGR